MMRRNTENSVSMVDMLFTLLLVIIALFALSQPITTVKKKSDILPKAEFILEMDWDEMSKTDIDVIFVSPDDQYVFFRKKDAQFYFLDRDDLGQINDTILSDNGVETLIPINREIVTMRGFVPGEYSVGAVYYSSNNNGNDVPEIVKMKIYKLNPFSIVFEGSIELTQKGDNNVFANFTLDSEGNVTSTNTDYINLPEIVGMIINDPTIDTEKVGP